MKKDGVESKFEKLGFEFPAAMRTFIEHPPLIEGESPEQFWLLLRSIVEEQKPECMTEWLSSYDMAVKRWEGHRLSRLSVALIQASMFNAVLDIACALEPESGLLTLDFDPRKTVLRNDVTKNFYNTDPQKRQEVFKGLEERGITQAEIVANALQRNVKSLQVVEQMRAAREIDQRKLRQEAAYVMAKKKDRNLIDRPASSSDGN